MTDDLLVAWMYRAAIGLDPWRMVLEQITQEFQGIGTHIVGIDKPSGKIIVNLHNSNVLAEGIGDYICHGDARNPVTVPGADLPVGRVINVQAANGHKLADTPLFGDFLNGCKYSHIIGGKIHDDDDQIALLGVCRDGRQGAFNRHDEYRLEGLLTHVSHSMDIVIGRREWHAHSDVGEALLGRSLRPSFLVGTGAKLVFVNGAGREALKKASVVVNRQGVLAARDLQADAKLKCALCAMGMLGPKAMGKCPDRIPMWLNEVTRGHRVPACLWAIRAHTTLRAFATSSMGMLILATADPSGRDVPDPLVLSSMFGFTPAESRIAAHLVAGAAPKQIATALDVGIPTVRHHIRWLLAKCHCQNLRQLVQSLIEALEVNGL